MPASQSTLVAADMARWDAQAAQHRAATPAGGACCRFHLALSSLSSHR
jgi:hypothetical protein